jgi:hypothetical protein
MSAPGFLTNHELDHFLGGGDSGQRQRQRLRADHLLPAPADLGKVRRFNVAVFPRFVLAGLVRDLAQIPEATNTLSKVTGEALRSNAFAEVRFAVRESARSLSTWNFDELVGAVVERAEDAVLEWDNVVVNAEQELADRLGISFSSETGMVKRVVGDICVIDLASGGEEHVPSTRVVALAEKGRAVVLERVRVLSKELGYIMPLEQITVDDDERELSAWFAKMALPTPPAAVIAETHVGGYQALPYGRAFPRRGRWHGASTMTRVSADI